MKFKASGPSIVTGMFLSLLFVCRIANGQGIAQPTVAANEIALLPDAPGMITDRPDEENASSSVLSPEASQDAQTSPNTPAQSVTAYEQGKQTKRILGIIPNFRSVSANVHLPPQSVGSKFRTATQDSFDYSSIFLPAVLAGYSQLTNATPEFHQGAAGYARYFWHTYVDQTSENYFVEFIVPAITHQDSRYYTLSQGTFLKRSGYALSRAVITRNDEGHDTFNSSEIVGAGAAAGMSNLYYPSAERTFNKTAQQWGTNVGVDALTFLFKEFWPDINHTIFQDTQ